MTSSKLQVGLSCLEERFAHAEQHTIDGSETSKITLDL